jgi:hypothetical protein
LELRRPGRIGVTVATRRALVGGRRAKVAPQGLHEGVGARRGAQEEGIDQAAADPPPGKHLVLSRTLVAHVGAVERDDAAREKADEDVAHVVEA